MPPRGNNSLLATELKGEVQLRWYQQEAVRLLREAFKRLAVPERKARLMLQLPTGGGKSVVAAFLVTEALRRGRPILFICERISLVEQIAMRFYDMGLHTSIMQGDHPNYDPTAPIQCASAQTLRRRKWPDAGLIIIDEAHVIHQIHKDIIEKWTNVPVLGLSATPWAKGLGKVFDELICNVDIATLIQEGFLVEPVVYGPATPNMKDVRIVKGEYEEQGSANEAMKIVGDVVKHWLKLANNRRTAMFCVNIAHSRALVAEFQAHGVNAKHVDAYTDSEERKQIFREFDEGDVRIISSVDVIGRGWDQPKVDCLIQARPTRSLMVHIQQVGRGLRTYEGKKDCLILDFAGNHERLGYCTDEFPTELNDGKKPVNESKPQEALPSPCPRCSYMKPPKTHKCPACGFAPERKSEVTHEEGELELKQAKKANKEPWEKKIAFMAGLKHYAKTKGYNEGWVYYTYREKYGVSPNDHRLRFAPPQPPNADVMGFIRHKQIKYARSQKVRRA